MGEIYKKFTTQLFEVIYQVEEEEEGLRLDQFLMRYFPSFSRQQIKKKIKSGDVKIQGRPYPHKASVKVYEREKVDVKTERGNLEDEYWRGEKLELTLDPEILFEDDNVLAVTKPPYMTTHPTGKHLFNCATVYFEEKHGKTIHSIHRLDRETSGVQLLAKNPKAAQKCTTFFEDDLVSKCYFLISHKKKNVSFPFTADERMGSLDDFIPKLYVHCFDENSDQGKHAKTGFDVLFENDDYIIALAFPRTGRQHQIRAHAAFHGFPLLGDKLYNGDPTVFMRFKDELASDDDHDLMQISRHALHAIALKLPYPNKEKASVFISSLPEDLIQWIESSISGIQIKDLKVLIENKINTYFETV